MADLIIGGRYLFRNSMIPGKDRNEGPVVIRELPGHTIRFRRDTSDPDAIDGSWTVVADFTPLDPGYVLT